MKKLFTILSLCVGLSTQLWAQEDLPPMNLTPNVLEKMGHGSSTTKAISANEWQLEDGTTVYSSIPYGQDIFGYCDCTPVFIAIKEGTVTSVVAGPNEETASYWVFLEEEHLFKSWNGKSMKDAEALEVDAISGATFSSMSVINTVKATLQAIMKK